MVPKVVGLGTLAGQVAPGLAGAVLKLKVAARGGEGDVVFEVALRAYSPARAQRKRGAFFF